jgi:hypothetical protein
MKATEILILGDTARGAGTTAKIVQKIAVSRVNRDDFSFQSSIQNCLSSGINFNRSPAPDINI